MHSFRDRSKSGFTLLEVMLVVLIISILSAIAIPMMARYDRKEDARGSATRLASVLAEARSRAISTGSNVLVLFNSPAVPQRDPDATALIVVDADANAQISTGDTVINVFPDPSMNPAVTPYGLGPSSPYPTASLPSEDKGLPPSAVLGDIGDGSSFFDDTTTGVPAVGFTSQGIPIALANPIDWNDFGSGAGAYYFTDNDALVFAVIQLPLGGVRVRVYEPSSDTWR